MNLNYNHFSNLDHIEIYLCNPNEDKIGVINYSDASVTIRFNDLSEIEFSTNRDDNYCYDLIEANRLLFVDSIGWFRIDHVTETSDGLNVSKNVSGSSAQSVFQKIGFYCHDSVYKFFDPQDAMDEGFSAGDTNALPSVVGQLCRQSNIRVSIGSAPPEGRSFDDWTITNISSALVFDVSSPICRAMNGESLCLYDWLMNRVEESFSVVFCFDFLRKSIDIRTADNSAVMSDLCLSFNNFMNGIDIQENAENITTVLTCSGEGLDISLVNPTGTNYIVDFSYYRNDKWMTNELISKIDEWEQYLSEIEGTHAGYVKNLSEEYIRVKRIDEKLSARSIEIESLKGARDIYISKKDGEISKDACVIVETIRDGENSVDPRSLFYKTSGQVTPYTEIRGYKEPPKFFESSGGVWMFSGEFIFGTIQDCINGGYVYFSDSNSVNFCKIESVIDVEGAKLFSSIKRYDRYCNIGSWIGMFELSVSELNADKDVALQRISRITSDMSGVTERANIISFMSDRPDLLRELRQYWFESEYINNSISVTDNMTIDEKISLAHELMECGRREIHHLSQPQRTFSIESSNFIGRKEYEREVRELNVGSVLSVEIEDGVWYYPALKELKFQLGRLASNISMTFTNKQRLDDWGYTYADMITESASASRSVSSNWRMLTEYSRDKHTIDSMIRNPLDNTMRAAFANSTNQEFVVDSTGVLGRKIRDRSSSPDDHNDPMYEDEQLRMINNVLLFTNDGWKTTKAAVGKIANQDGSYSYGIIAEVLVGDLMVGKDLRIVNDGRSITIDEKGITILKDGLPVFYADDEGNLNLIGNISTNNIDVSGGKIVIPGEDSGVSRSAVITNGGMYLTNNKTGEVDGESDRSIFIGAHGVDFLVGVGNGHASHSVASVRNSSAGVQYMLAGSSIIVSPAQRRLVGEWQIETATSSTAVVSDRNRKDNIGDIPDAYSDLHKSLRPVIYTYKDGDSGRTHTGFIAQDIEDSLHELGLTTKEFAAVCYDINEDGEKVNYGVRYDEIVALNTKEIQRLNKEIKVLQEQLSALIGSASSVDENIAKEE